MKPAAIGIRMHSGWGILVAVVGPRKAPHITDRRRIVVISDETNSAWRGNQPYHHAATLGLAEAEKYLAEYSAETERLAREQIAFVIDELKASGFTVTNAAVVLASGRTLPPLAQILAAHPLIHTAEGELFRQTVRHACESLHIPIEGYREADLRQSKFADRIAGLGKILGPPWTADHKSASLAAYLALHSNHT